MRPDSAWWRLTHLEPALFRTAVVAVFTLLGSVGITVSDRIPDALVTVLVSLAAVVTAVWVRSGVTPNATVAVTVPDPSRPSVVEAGEAVVSERAKPEDIIAAAITKG